MEDRVSIIIPVRNEEKNIGLLLQSIMQQAAHFDEVVITDGTSTDRTREIIDEFRGKDARIRLLLKPNSFCGEGRNHSMRNASGSIFVFLDAGMIPDHDWLERLLNCFSSDDTVDFAFGRVNFDECGHCIPQSWFQRLVGCIGYPPPDKWVKTVPGSGVRRRLWEDWGGFPEAVVGEDVLLFKKLEREGIRCGYAKDAVVRYFDFPSTYLAVWRKWFVRVKVWTQFPEMRGEVLRGLVTKGGVVMGVVVLLTLGAIKPLWLIAVPFVLAGRVLVLVRKHPKVLRMLLQSPQYWLTAILVSVTIDFARMCGLSLACAESLRRR